jgi:hypothetical protein
MTASDNLFPRRPIWLYIMVAVFVISAIAMAYIACTSSKDVGMVLACL